jgi:hypothetical protein
VSINAEENLIRNGSFEEIVNENVPLHWRIHAWTLEPSVDQFGIDKENYTSGNQSVFIHNSRENHCYYIQRVSVQENTFYKISGWIKTENVGQNSEGAGISLIDYFDVGGNFKGTGDWQYAELYVTIGPGVSNIEVMLQIGNYGALNTGKAWFDNISMTKVNTIPANVAIAAVTNKKSTSNVDNVETRDEDKTEPVKQQKNQGVFIFFLIVIIVVLLTGIAAIIIIIVVRKKSDKPGKEEEDEESPEK